MGGLAEYLFAEAVDVADQAAYKQGWQPRGRVGWRKPDGTIVHFLWREQQLVAVPHGARLYVVGKPSTTIRRTNKVVCNIN